MILAALATTVLLGITTIGAVAEGEPGCGGGFAWGDWSVPINTLLLILLALITAKGNQKVDQVKRVTDKVKLREKSRKVDLEP